LVAGAAIGAAACAQLDPPAPQAAATAPAEAQEQGGLLCSLGRLHIIESVGRRCFAGQDGAFQAGVAEAIARLEERAQAGGMSRADLHAFASSMAGAQRPEASVCDLEGRMIYRTAVESGLDPLRAEVERQVARPGPPGWGTCR
jgi:hypothetical protein